MLGDISNHLRAQNPASGTAPANKPQQPLHAPVPAHAAAGGPARWAQASLLANSVASTSSSPGRTATSSSPFFPRTRLDAFDAPTSPAASSVVDKLPTSPLRGPNHISLPPSSPSFGFSKSSTHTAALDELVHASALASRATSPALVSQAQPTASTSSKPDPGLDTPRTLHLERDSVLYFGRKARKALPRHRGLLGEQDDTHVPVILPRTAKNASRIHCSARIVDRLVEREAFVIEVRVTGQNGMKVDGKVRRNGSIVRVEKRAGAVLKLSFWGWSAKVIVAESEVGLDDAEESDLESLSPVTESADESGPAPEEVGEDAPRPSKARRRAPSPALSFRSDDHGLSPEPELSAPAAPSSRASSVALVPSAAALAAANLAHSLGLDLPGLIASAIVFHARSTVAATEVVHGLLTETRSMWTILTSDEEELERLKDSPKGEQRAVEAWREVVEETLAREDMFGMIDNSGLKDASGRPLPPYYFYIPDQDPSADRVAALEPFVKRVRGARTKKQARYFWAKPSLKRNR